MTVEKSRCQHVRVAAVPHQFFTSRLEHVRAYESLNTVSFSFAELGEMFTYGIQDRLINTY